MALSLCEPATRHSPLYPHNFLLLPPNTIPLSSEVPCSFFGDMLILETWQRCAVPGRGGHELFRRREYRAGETAFWPGENVLAPDRPASQPDSMFQTCSRARDDKPWKRCFILADQIQRPDSQAPTWNTRCLEDAWRTHDAKASKVAIDGSYVTLLSWLLV